MIRQQVWKALGAVWLACALATAALAAKPPPETVAADKILQRWMKAIGGEKRLKRVQQAEYRGQVEFPNTPPIELTIRVASGVGVRSEMKLPNGVLVSGSDGRRGWREHPLLGGAVLATAEAQVMLRETDPRWPLHVKQHFTRRRALPEQEVEGRRLQVLELSAAEGPPELWYFDPATGHRVRRERTNFDGARETTLYSDFREVDGLVEAWKVVARSGGTEFTGTLNSVDWRPAFDAAELAPPAEFFNRYARTDEVLARHLAVSGGAEAAAKIHSRLSHATVEIVSAGIAFETRITQRTPNYLLSEQDVPGMGRVLQGYDGRTGWTWSELQGYRELAGPELQQAINSAQLHGMLQLRQALPFRKWLGEQEVDGRTCHAIELAMMQGTAGTHYFDAATGHLVRIESVVHTGPGGVVKVLLDFDDFRDVDGLVLPFRMTLTNPAMKMVTVTKRVEHNGEFPDRIFRPRKDGDLPEG